MRGFRHGLNWSEAGLAAFCFSRERERKRGWMWESNRKDSLWCLLPPGQYTGCKWACASLCASVNVIKQCKTLNSFPAGGCPLTSEPVSDRSCDPACDKPRSICTEVSMCASCLCLLRCDAGMLADCKQALWIFNTAGFDFLKKRELVLECIMGNDETWEATAPVVNGRFDIRLSASTILITLDGHYQTLFTVQSFSDKNNSVSRLHGLYQALWPMSDGIRISHTYTAVEISAGQIKHLRKDMALSVESFIVFWMAVLEWLVCLKIFYGCLCFWFDCKIL